MLPKSREMLDESAVQARFQLPPSALCDLQAMMGDAAVRAFCFALLCFALLCFTLLHFASLCGWLV
jgi:hypothetical protein